jgi:predicted permease
LQATRFDIRESLNEEARGSSGSIRHRRMRSVLVVAEIALALVLLVGAGLLLRSFAALTSVSPGFETRNLLLINLPLSPRAYGDNVVRTAAVDRILERVSALPGISKAAVTTMVPMAGAGATIHFNRAAFPPKGAEEYVMAGYRAVTPDYLATIGVPLVRGRLLEARDRAGAPPVVVINQSMARQYFPGLDPIGQRMQIGTEPDPNFPTMEVVGVVGDVKQSFEAGSKSEFFVPYAQFPDPVLTGMYLNVALVARTSADPAAAVPAVRAALREIDANQPLVNVRTMESAMAGTVAQPRLQMVLLVLFAAVAAALAVIGVYGVMAYTVSQRVAEIGVRMAMGASPSQVVALVVRHGAALAVAGIALGLVASVAAARAVQSLLFVEARGFPPVTFAAAAAVLLLAALAASYIPARRAARVSPVSALTR